MANNWNGHCAASKRSGNVPVFYVKSNENHTISNQAMSSAQLRKKQYADGYVLQGMNNKFFAYLNHKNNTVELVSYYLLVVGLWSVRQQNFLQADIILVS